MAAISAARNFPTPGISTHLRMHGPATHHTADAAVVGARSYSCDALVDALVAAQVLRPSGTA
jgi:hypothetical protein